MKNLYIVETWRWVRAECRVRNYAELQAEEYLNNYWWTVRLYNYAIENPNIDFQVLDWELSFFEDDTYIYPEELEEHWVKYKLLKTIEEPILDY